MSKAYPVRDTWKKKAKKRRPVSGSVWWLRDPVDVWFGLKMGGGPVYKAPVDTDPTPGSEWEQIGWIDDLESFPTPIAEVQDAVIFGPPKTGKSGFTQKYGKDREWMLCQFEDDSVATPEEE